MTQIENRKFLFLEISKILRYFKKRGEVNTSVPVFLLNAIIHFSEHATWHHATEKRNRIPNFGPRIKKTC